MDLLKEWLAYEASSDSIASEFVKLSLEGSVDAAKVLKALIHCRIAPLIALLGCFRDSYCSQGSQQERDWQGHKVKAQAAGCRCPSSACE
jgi:hypothetical protein